MKTLLVPVDFTATSENAVYFSAEWAKQYNYERIILLKTFYDSMFENIIVSAEYSNVNQHNVNSLREEAKEHLDALCKRLAARVGDGIKVMTAVSEYPLLRGINEIIKNKQPALIIVGSDNYRQSSGSFISAQVISIAKTSPVRVLVVPAKYIYQPIQAALVPCDYNAMESLDKLNGPQPFPQWESTRLLILNVDPKERYKNYNDRLQREENNLHSYLKNFQHELYYSNDKNIIDGIINFTKSHAVQLIIALRGRQSFLYSLTHKSISQAIYKDAQQPVLILK